MLKAFNTTFASTLSAGSVGPLTTTVLIAGDDADAKSTLAGVITSGGLNAIDAGPLERARELESHRFPADHPGRQREDLLDRRLRRRGLINTPDHTKGSTSMTVNAVRLNHAVLYVADLERSIAFYQQAFAWR